MNTPENPAIALIEAYENSQREVETLRESISEVRAMMDYEDRGWQLVSGIASGDRLEGLEVEEVQDIAKKIAPRVAAGMPKRAVDLHSGFVWGRGCYIEGTQKPKGRGAPPRSVASLPTQTTRTVFSPIAPERNFRRSGSSPGTSSLR